MNSESIELEFTPKAVKMAKRKLQEAPEPVLGLRLGVRGGGCSGVSYAVEFSTSKRDNDRIFAFDDLQVFVDPKSLEYLRGTVVDWEDKLVGYGFKFRNPNAKAGCGCGSSFGI